MTRISGTKATALVWLTSERSVSEFSHCTGGCRPLGFCLYDRYEYESKRSGVLIFFSSAKPAGGLLVEQDQGSRPTSHAVSATSRKNRRRLRPFEAVGRTRPPAILSALRALRVSTVGSVAICSGQQSVAGAAGGTKVLTPDLFATYFDRAHDRKSSGRQLLLQCENRSIGSEEVGHREEWLVSRQALRARQSGAARYLEYST